MVVFFILNVLKLNFFLFNVNSIVIVGLGILGIRLYMLVLNGLGNIWYGFIFCFG